MQNNSELLETMAILYGQRFPDYMPGCPACDAWHMYDIGAVEALSVDIREVDAFMDTTLVWEAD